MPSANEYSKVPAENVSIGGTNVAEQCSPGNINDAIRYLAATQRDTFDRIPATGAYVPTTGGTFTGDILRGGRGAFLHHAGSAQSSGQVYFLPEGSARPTAAEGSVVFYYA